VNYTQEVHASDSLLSWYRIPEGVSQALELPEHLANWLRFKFNLFEEEEKKPEILQEGLEEGEAPEDLDIADFLLQE